MTKAYIWVQDTARVDSEYTSDLILTLKFTHLEKVIGKFYYYVRTVDHIMLVALGGMVTRQMVGTSTKQAADNIVMLLYYTTSHSNATIQYHASGMTLHADSDASCLSVRKARSRVGRNYYLSVPSSDPTKLSTITLPPNGPLRAVSSILRNVVTSVAETEM